MKRFVGWVLGIVLVATAGAVAFAQYKEKAAPSTTTGELVDVECYLQHGEKAKGMDHAGCAKTCLGKGAPAGLLMSSGDLYVVFFDPHKEKIDFVPFAGKQVEVTGTTHSRGGIKGILVSSIKDAPKN